MYGINVKRGIEALVEKLYQQSNQRGGFEVNWHDGRTVGIARNPWTRNFWTVYLPNINETATIGRHDYNILVGYVIHELGHAWFSDQTVWDSYRTQHGDRVGLLINGLEDPRIEKCVIDSGYAQNSAALFDLVVSSVLLRDGYVEPRDWQNIPFVLAIEGRRLNGYSINVPSVLPRSPWRNDLEWALREAQAAPDTARVCEIALELHERLQRAEPHKPGDDAQSPGDGAGEASDPQADGEPGSQHESASDGSGEETQGDPEQGTQGDPEQGTQGDPEQGTPGKGRSIEPGDLIAQHFKDSTLNFQSDEMLAQGYENPKVEKPTFLFFEYYD